MTRQMVARREVLLVVLLTLLAAALRLWNLGDVPPGLFSDEAFNGLSAWRVIRDGWHPTFFEANAGREPLVIYLISAALWALGPTVGALRLAPALLGTLTTPALYVLGRTLYGWRTGFLATLAWATTFSAIAMSRVAFRAVALPLLATLTLWLILLALRRLQRRARFAWHLALFALAGLILGLTLYTYAPGRVFPLVVAVLAVHWGLAYRPPWRRWVAGTIVLVAVAALVYAPLGAYFLTTPEAFTSRVSDISVFALEDPLQSLLQSTVDHLAILAWHGDIDPVRNLPGLPILDPWLALCVLAGLVVCLRRFLEPTRTLPVIWAVLLFLPSLIARGLPDVLHLAGMLPALFLLAGLGAATAWTWCEHRLPSARKWIPAAVVVALFTVSGAVSTWHYFADWASDPAVAIAYHAPLVDLASAANERVAGGESVLLPQSVYHHPSVAYLTRYTCPRAGGFPSEGLQIPDDSVFLVPPDYDDEATFILLSTPVARFLPPFSLLTTRQLREASGTPVFGRWDKPIARIVKPNRQFVDDWPTNLHVLGATFDDQITLSSYTLGGSDTQRPRVTPGEDVMLLVYWEAARVPERDYRVFLHLLDANGRVWGGWDGPPASSMFPTGAWRPGEIIPAVYRVPVDADPSTGPGQALSPGKYGLEIGLYHLFTGARLDAVSADGVALGSRALLGPLKVPADQAAPGAAPSFPAQANFGDLIELSPGYDVEPVSLTLKPGDSLHVALHWRCLALMDTDYTVFVHLTDDAGRPVAQHDGQPYAGRYPTSIWDVGEAVLDVHKFAVPADITPGTYYLVVGVYDHRTGQRLSVLDESGQPVGDHMLLKPIKVIPL